MRFKTLRQALGLQKKQVTYYIGVLKGEVLFFYDRVLDLVVLDIENGTGYTELSEACAVCDEVSLHHPYHSCVIISQVGKLEVVEYKKNWR